MDSASTISQLLRLYEERYTFRRINIQAVAITFSAALLLVFATVFHYQRDREDEILADLSVCFRALDELAPSWDTAKRARDFLIRLQRHWEREMRLRTSGADTSYPRSSGFSGSRKRPHASIRPSDENNESRPVRFRNEGASPLQREYWADNSTSANNDIAANYSIAADYGMAANFGMDIDFDWMLASSIEVMPGNWGNVVSVPLSPILPNYPN
jgi:hypothetical protein